MLTRLGFNAYKRITILGPPFLKEVHMRYALVPRSPIVHIRVKPGYEISGARKGVNSCSLARARRFKSLVGFSERLLNSVTKALRAPSAAVCAVFPHNIHAALPIAMSFSG